MKQTHKLDTICKGRIFFVVLPKPQNEFKCIVVFNSIISLFNSNQFISIQNKINSNKFNSYTCQKRELIQFNSIHELNVKPLYDTFYKISYNASGIGQSIKIQ